MSRRDDKDFDDLDLRIMQAIKQNPRTARNAITKALQAPHTTIFNRTKRLEALGKIREIRTSTHALLELVEESPVAQPVQASNDAQSGSKSSRVEALNRLIEIEREIERLHEESARLLAELGERKA